MERINSLANKFKYLFLAFVAVVLSLIFVKPAAKVDAALTCDGYSFTQAISGYMPTASGNYYLTSDYDFGASNYTVSSGTIRIYLNGHNIYLNGQRIIVTGGTLSFHDDHTNSTWYGLDSNGKVDLTKANYLVTGGYIAGGSTSQSAIYVNGSTTSATCELYGGNIFGNRGGAVTINKGSFNMKGGRIAGNQASYGAGVYVANSSSTFNFTGGQIEHNTATTAGGAVFQYGRMHVGGSASATSNYVGSTLNNVQINTTIAEDKILYVDSKLSGRIGITSSSTTALTKGYGTYNSEAPYTYFLSDVSTKGIQVTTVSSIKEAIFGDPNSSTDTHVHIGGTYTAWTGTTSLPSTAGTYYLANDITLSSSWTVPSGDVTLCLNGHSINLNGKYINVFYSTNFKLYDCSDVYHYYTIDETGKAYIGSGDKYFKGGYIYGATSERALYIGENSSYTKAVELNGGTFIGNSSGAVYIKGQKNSLTVSCNIIGNTTKTASTNKEGSAIYANDHRGVHIYSATIKYNTSYVENGCAVYNANSSYSASKISVTTKPIITENKDLNGNASNVYIGTGTYQKLFITSALNNGSKVGLYTPANITTTIDTVLTSGYGSYMSSYDPNGYFTSDNEDGVILYSSSEVSVRKGHKHGDTAYLLMTALPSSAGNYYVSGSLKLTANWSAPTGETTICLNGGYIDFNGYTISVPVGATLNIIDCQDYSGSYYINSKGVAVVSATSGNIDFDGGYLCDTKSQATSPTNSNTFIAVKGGTLNLEGINIFGSMNSAITAETYSSTKSTVNMTGGTIAGCKGGIYLNGATASVSDVRFYSNYKNGYGVAFYASGLTSFIMDNCYFDSNKTTSTSAQGGAMYLNCDDATIDLCTFIKNQAGYGGAISISYGDIIVSNSEFSDNKALYATGGAINNEGTLTLSDVNIYSNKAEAVSYGAGGGIANYGSLTLMNYINITDNSSKLGGGIANYGEVHTSGEILISGNYDTSNKNSNYYMNNSTTGYITLDGPFIGSTLIGISPVVESTQITMNYSNYHENENPMDYFVLDDESSGLNVAIDNDEVYILDIQVQVHDGITFAEWTSETSLPTSGSYFLANDVTFASNSTITVESGHTLNLCLNGHKVNFSNNVSAIKVDGEFNIYDCVTDYSNYVWSSSDTFTKVTSITSSYTDYSFSGGYMMNARNAIYVSSTGTFSMYGGTLIGNSSLPTGKGGAVYLNGGTFNMYGGYICGNYAVEGAAIYLDTNSNVYLSGGTIEYNKAETSGAGILYNGSTQIYLKGGIKVRNNYLLDGTLSDIEFDKYCNNPLYINGTFKTGAEVYVKLAKSKVLTSGYNGYNANAYNNLSPTYYIKNDQSDVTFTKANGELSGDLPHTHSFTYTKASNGYELYAVCQNAGCPLDENPTITLIAESREYNRTQYSATVDMDDFISITGVTPTVSYVYSGTTFAGDTYATSVTAPTEAGTYQVQAFVSIGSSLYNLKLNFTIEKKAIHVDNLAVSSGKKYDGTTDIAVDSNYNIVGAIQGDVLSINAEAAFEDKNVGTNKPVTIIITGLSGSGCDNYYLEEDTFYTTSSIVVGSLVVSALTINDKEYDGTTAATIDFSSVQFTYLRGNDEVTFSATAAFDDKTVGTNKPVTLSNTSISGADASNYVFSISSSLELTASITKKNLVVSGIVANDKVYDKKSNATFNTDNMVVEGLVAGEDVTVSVSGAYDVYTVGYQRAYINLALSGEDSANYQIDEDNSQNESYSNITKAILTIGYLVGVNKTYDGTAAARISCPSVSGIMSKDTVYVSAVGHFIDANASTSTKTIYIDEFVLDGSSASNYQVSSNTSTTTYAFIYQAALKISGITANDKDYDGTTAATLDFSNVIIEGLVGEETVTVSATGTFENAAVGTNKLVTISDYVLSGEYASNYTVTAYNSQTEAYADIILNEINPTITGFDGVYDGQYHGVTLTDLPDVYTIYYYNEETDEFDLDSLEYKDAGSYIIQFLISSPSCEDYIGAGAVDILKKEVTVSGITANDKDYDGTTSATLDFTNVVIDGLIIGDDLTVSANALFEDANAAENITVYISNIALGGESAANYELTATGNQEEAIATINKRPVTISGITANNKDYDGNTSATLDYTNVVIDGLISGTSLTVTATGEFVDANIGTNKTVNITNITLSGDSIANYILAEDGNQETTTATISRIFMNLEVIGYEGIYDKGVHYITINGIPEGSTIKYSSNNNIYVSYRIGFDTPGTYRVYYEIYNPNYYLAQGSETIVISKKPVTVSGIKAIDKDYDGTTAATLDYSDVVVDGVYEGHSVIVEATASFIDANAGENKEVAISNFIIVGGDFCPFYEIAETGNQETTTATINKVDMPEFVVNSYVGTYDRFSHRISISGYPENSTVKYSDDNEYYSTSNPGFMNAGTHTVYYRVEHTNYKTVEGTSTVVINKRLVTVSGIKANNKVYDGTTSVTLDLSDVLKDGLYSGDSIGLAISASFENPNVGNNKLVNITLALNGTSYNYDLDVDNSQHYAYANITKYTMNDISVTGYEGTYDKEYHRIDVTGYPEGATISYSLDDIVYSSSNPEYINAGTYLVYFMVDCENYERYKGSETVIINQKEITISGIKASNKTYDGNTSVTLNYSGIIYNGILEGDSLEVSLSASFISKNAAYNKQVLFSNVELLGNSKDNYKLASDSQSETTANIYQKTVTVTGITVSDKVYDKKANVPFDFSNIVITGMVSGDSLYVGMLNGAYDNSNAGTNKKVTISYILLSGSDSSNYELSSTGNQKTTTGNILPREIIIKSGVKANDKVYDGTTYVVLDCSDVVIQGAISSDVLLITATGSFVDFNAGENKEVLIDSYTITNSSNYYIKETGNQETTTANISKADMDLTVETFNGTYDKEEHKISINNVPANSTIKYSVEENGEYSLDEIILINAGTYEIWYLIENDNYNTINDSITLVINARELSFTGIKANNKVYDGNKDVVLDYTDFEFINLIEGDEVSINLDAKFIDSNAGDNKLVEFSDISLSGSSKDNYYLSDNIQVSAYANIRNAAMNIIVTGYEGTYDKNSHGISVTNYPAGSVITYSNDENGTYDTNNILFTNAGSYRVYFKVECANYESFEGSETIIIESKKVTVSGIIANDKDYDDNTSATLDYTNVVINGLIEGDELIVSATGTFDNSNAGNYKTVYISNISLSGSSVINYDLDLSGNQSTTKASINKIDMNLIVTGYNGDYDKEIHKVIINGAPDNSTINYSIDGITYSTTNPEFINAGTCNVYYNIYNPNYNNVVGIETIVINKRAITVSGIKANDKVYDGNVDATLVYTNVIINGLIQGDILEVSAVGKFIDSNYGLDKIVNISNIELSGEASNNYYLASTGNQTETTASITKTIMNITVAGYEGTYDKDYHGINITNYPDGSVVTYSSDENGLYDINNILFVNAGTYKVYFKVECASYEDYKGFETIIINQKEVTVSGIKADNKIYDGTTSATLDFSDVTIEGLLSGDTLEVSATGEFDNKNAGSNKTVNISNLVLSDETNYKVSANSQTEANANISSKVIEITSIKVLDKKYDKTTDATIDYDTVVIEGVVDGDKVTIIAKASFEDAKSGKDKKVTITDIRLDGLDKNNYKVELNQIEASANIIKVKTSSLSGGAVAGIIIAAIAISGLIGFALYWFIFKKKKA